MPVNTVVLLCGFFGFYTFGVVIKRSGSFEKCIAWSSGFLISRFWGFHEGVRSL